MLDLEPPKPTKEFHDAYLEIYGKNRKRTEEKPKEPVQPMFSLDVKKSAVDDFDKLDLPPPKIEPLPKLELTLPMEQKKEQKTEKKGILSGLFGKKKEQKVEEKQGKEEHLPTIPKLPKFDFQLPTFKPSEHKELVDGEPVDLTSFSKEEHAAMNELEKLDLPPPKIIEKKHSLFDIESAIHAKPNIPLFDKPKKQEKAKETKAKPIHDFLAEIKFGAKKTELKQEKQEEKKEIPFEKKEALFEKEKTKEGARDLQTAYEKTHPFETGGFEYIPKIKPLEKEKIPISSFEIQEEKQELPVAKVSEFKSRAEFKKQVAALKQYEQKIKKSTAARQKKEKEVQAWIKKQQAQEKKIDEKMCKMQTMEKELFEKQQDILQYEPKMRALWQKEDEITTKESATKQKLQEAQETEMRIKAEEDAIVAKIRKLEANQKALEREEDAIQKTVARLDKDRVVISAKTREFANIVKEIGNAEKELKEKSQLLDDREQRIKKKEKLIEMEFTRIQKLKKTAERLKDVEETYTRMKDRLRQAYREYEEKFANQQAYAPQEIKAVPIQPTFQPVRPLREAKAVESGDITNLITATKQLIIEKHYDEANKNINRLMQRYIQIPDNNPRKKEIYYEILGLKNMLKLDLLE